MLISVEGNSKCLQSPAKMCCFSEKLKNIHALLDLVHVWKGKETTSWRCRQTDHNSSYYKAISQLKINSSSFDHIRYKPNIEIYICFSFSSNSAIPPKACGILLPSSCLVTSCGGKKTAMHTMIMAPLIWFYYSIVSDFSCRG